MFIRSNSYNEYGLLKLLLYLVTGYDFESRENNSNKFVATKIVDKLWTDLLTIL
jgi:hypothetical protein